MDIRPALKRQYHASLAMLRQAIEDCPDPLWDDDETHDVPFWRVAYHTLYFTHLYLHPTLEAFQPWALHRDEYHDLPWPPDSGTKIADPYSNGQLMEYWAIVDAFVDGAVDRMDLSAPGSGIPWHAEMPKLEHQLHNVRHIQHHTGLLAGRVRTATGTVVRWVRPKV